LGGLSDQRVQGRNEDAAVESSFVIQVVLLKEGAGCPAPLGILVTFSWSQEELRLRHLPCQP
jgi:hypothetical protein